MLTEGTQETYTWSHSKEVDSLFDLYKLDIWIYLRTHTYIYANTHTNT